MKKLSYDPVIEEALFKKKLTITGLAKEAKISVPTTRSILLREDSQCHMFRESAQKRIAQILGISQKFLLPA